MRGLFQKRAGGLGGADDAAVKILARIPPGTNVWADVTVPRDQRSVQMHRLYFALLGKVFENLPERWAAEIPSVDVLRLRLAYTIGWTEVIQTGAGPREVPKSIAFDKLGQAEFYDKVWTPTVKVVTETLIPGIAVKELEREIDDMLKPKVTA